MTPRATVESDERLRLFLALQLPGDVEAALAEWGRSRLQGGRVLETFHVTLAFLGARPRGELEGILGVLRRAAAATGAISLSPLRYRETRSVGMVVLDDRSGEATRVPARGPTLAAPRHRHPLS